MHQKLQEQEETVRKARWRVNDGECLELPQSQLHVRCFGPTTAPVKTRNSGLSHRHLCTRTVTESEGIDMHGAFFSTDISGASLYVLVVHWAAGQSHARRAVQARGAVGSQASTADVGQEGCRRGVSSRAKLTPKFDASGSTIWPPLLLCCSDAVGSSSTSSPRNNLMIRHRAVRLAIGFATGQIPLPQRMQCHCVPTPQMRFCEA